MEQNHQDNHMRNDEEKRSALEPLEAFPVELQEMALRMTSSGSRSAPRRVALFYILDTIYISGLRTLTVQLAR